MMRGINSATAVILAFFAGLVVSFFTLPIWVTFVINFAREGGRSDWIGLFGNVIGVMMTLIAAVVAWFAVQQQIRAQELSAQRAIEQQAGTREREMAEAKFAATMILTQPVHAAATALNTIDQALESLTRSLGGGGPHAMLEFAKKKENVAQAMSALKATMNHFAIAQAWQGLSIDDKTNYLIITATLHTVLTINEHRPPITDIRFFQNQRDALSNLAIYLKAFDTDLADVYIRDAKL
jgi:hypothetical protein